MERVDLGPYKYVDVNVTGFRMVDPSTPKAQQYVKKWEYMGGMQDDTGAKGKEHPLYVRKIVQKLTSKVLVICSSPYAPVVGQCVDV